MTIEHLKVVLESEGGFEIFVEDVPRIREGSLAQQLALRWSSTRSHISLHCQPKSGCECVAHIAQAMTFLDPNTTLLSVDGIGAFDLISREAVLEGCWSKRVLISSTNWPKQKPEESLGICVRVLVMHGSRERWGTLLPCNAAKTFGLSLLERRGRCCDAMGETSVVSIANCAPCHHVNHLQTAAIQIVMGDQIQVSPTDVCTMVTKGDMLAATSASASTGKGQNFLETPHTSTSRRPTLSSFAEKGSCLCVVHRQSVFWLKPVHFAP